MQAFILIKTFMGITICEVSLYIELQMRDYQREQNYLHMRVSINIKGYSIIGANSSKFVFYIFVCD